MLSGFFLNTIKKKSVYQGEPGRCARDQRWVRSSPTLRDSVVVNVDESVMASPRLAGLYGFRNDPDILLFELVGIYHGLSMAWELGHRVVECQSDSLHAVNLVLSTPGSRHAYTSII